jgi:hypothetical protein
MLWGLALAACTNEPMVSPAATDALDAAAPTSPAAKSVSGTVWNWLSAPKYAGSIQVDYYGVLPVIITGSGFGKTAGTLGLSNDAYRLGTAKVSWSDTRIVFYPTSKLTAGADPSLTITITRADKASTKISFKAVPSIRLRTLGQSTWWTAKRRIERKGNGRESGGATRGAYSSNTALDSKYVPTANDVWMSANQSLGHQAFVESVAARLVSDDRKIGVRVVEYHVLLSQYNTRIIDAKRTQLDETLRTPPYAAALRYTETYNLKSGKLISRVAPASSKFAMYAGGPVANRVWR